MKNPRKVSHYIVLQLFIPKKMDKIIKSTLKIQIEAYLTKFADPTLKEVKKWLFEGTTPGPEVLSSINYQTLTSFINYDMKKFKNNKSRVSHKGSKKSFQ